MNAKETAGLLAYFANAWPASNVTPEQAEIWADQLIGVTIEDGRSAAKELVASSQFFPTVAAFREACRAQVRRREGSQRALGSGPADLEGNLARLREIRARIINRSEAPCDVMGQSRCRECSEREDNR